MDPQQQQQPQGQDWKSRRYRYHISLNTGQEVDTNYYDSYADLENWIKSGAAGVLTPNGFVEIPVAAVRSIQPIEEGQAQGQQPQEQDVQAPPAAPVPLPTDDQEGVPIPQSGIIQPTQPAQDSEGTLQIPRDDNQS